ncbi:MAG: CBS domain-containing protein, partial [Actinomycetota bacterium]|nr:CBS domain-containing protein [Actinomycetota bacterium]
MESTFTLLRVRGIPIGINWSWLFVFAIVVWSLSTVLFPATYPGLEGTAYLAMAVVAAALFFGSVLLHELGHALRAVREGMQIEGITLWLLGGVAKLRGTPPSPGVEFRVAVWGPAITLALAAAFGLAALLGDRLGAPRPIQGVVDYLARINALVLAFNLVPALPLDGGRVLRAWLWRRQRSFPAATRSAAKAGQAFGFMLVAVGLLELFTGSGLGGIWFAFLGWFLIQASQAEATMAAVRQALVGAKVRDLMTSDVVTVPPDLPVAALVDHGVAGRRFSTYPVVSNGALVGTVSLKAAAAVPPGERGSVRVRDVMVPATQVAALAPDDDVFSSLQALEPARRGVVVEDGRLVGVLSASDVARAVEVNLAGPQPEAPRRSGVLVWVLVTLAILVAGAALYHPPYVVIAPGPTEDVSDEISISGVPLTEVNGEYLLTSVTLHQPSALRALVAVLRPDRDVLPLASVIPRDVGPDEYYRTQRNVYRESRMLAAAAAARSVGLAVSVRGNGARIVDLLPGTSVAESLRRGDVVVAIDGQPVTRARDLGPIVRSRPAGSTFRLTVAREGQQMDVEVASKALPSLSGGVGLGVAVETEGLEVDLPFDIRFAERDDVAGPSAGLTYA